MLGIFVKNAIDQVCFQRIIVERPSSRIERMQLDRSSGTVVALMRDGLEELFTSEIESPISNALESMQTILVIEQDLDANVQDEYEIPILSV